MAQLEVNDIYPQTPSQAGSEFTGGWVRWLTLANEYGLAVLWRLEYNCRA